MKQNAQWKKTVFWFTRLTKCIRALFLVARMSMLLFFISSCCIRSVCVFPLNCIVLCKNIKWWLLEYMTSLMRMNGWGALWWVLMCVRFYLCLCVCASASEPQMIGEDECATYRTDHYNNSHFLIWFGRFTLPWTSLIVYSVINNMNQSEICLLIAFDFTVCAWTVRYTTRCTNIHISCMTKTNWKKIILTLGAKGLSRCNFNFASTEQIDFTIFFPLMHAFFNRALWAEIKEMYTNRSVSFVLSLGIEGCGVCVSVRACVCIVKGPDIRCVLPFSLK